MCFKDPLLNEIFIIDEKLQNPMNDFEAAQGI